MANPESFLPPGFRFHPTDEELILHYLRNKAAATPCPASIIAEVDIYKFDPWDLPAKAAFGEKEWYFFSPRDRKYPNGARPNRAAVSGYWKATGTDRPILASQGGNGNIGVKKALVFYKGRPPKGIKTNWIMHEFRLPESPSSKPNYKYKDLSMRLDDWVLCRIYKKSNGQLSTVITMKDHQELGEHFIQDSPIPLPLETSSNFPNQNSLKLQKSLSFSDLFDAMDYSTLSRIMSDNPLDPIGFESAPILDNCSIDHQNILNKCSLNNNSSYLIQRPSQGDSFMEKQLKHERSTSEEVSLHPSKKLKPSCSAFTNNNSTTSSQFDASQYHLLNQPFFNQQLLLSSHLQL